MVIINRHSLVSISFRHLIQACIVWLILKVAAGASARWPTQSQATRKNKNVREKGERCVFQPSLRPTDDLNTFLGAFRLKVRFRGHLAAPDTCHGPIDVFEHEQRASRPVAVDVHAGRRVDFEWWPVTRVRHVAEDFSLIHIPLERVKLVVVLEVVRAQQFVVTRAKHHLAVEWKVQSPNEHSLVDNE